MSALSPLSRLSLIATEQTQHAQQALESLATGIDPAGGAELGPTTAWKVLRRPEIIRALLLGARAVDRLWLCLVGALRRVSGRTRRSHE